MYIVLLLRFDSDINSANDSARKEHLEKEQLLRKIQILEADNTDLEQRYKVVIVIIHVYSHTCPSPDSEPICTIVHVTVLLFYTCTCLYMYLNYSLSLSLSRKSKKAINSWKTKRVRWKPNSLNEPDHLMLNQRSLLPYMAMIALTVFIFRLHL